MKILHTADWHIGKKLYNQSLEEEQQEFFQWLLQTVDEEQIEVLLVSGDIFDVGYPATQAQKLYYNFLVALKNTTCRQVIITGGNHDSVSTLEAPRELLKALNITVIGGPTEDPADLLIPICNQSGTTEAMVAAVPFLRDRDLLRKSNAEATLEERAGRVQEAIVTYYHELSQQLSETRKQVIPTIAMGHFFMQNVKQSDSEREIQIGNLGGVSSSKLSGLFDYWALGHIHRPQKVDHNDHIRYSGSPLPLSFSERDHTKQMVILETREGKLEPNTLEIPLFRPLYFLEGSYEEVQEQLSGLQNSEASHKTPWVDLKIRQDSPDPSIIPVLQEQKENLQDRLNIINFKIELNQTNEGFSGERPQQDFAELTPRQVFKSYLHKTNHTPEEQEELETLMEEILEDITHEIK